MNIYDQILASAYYVFDGELTSQIIKSFITLLKKSGIILNRNETKMDELRKYMEFENHKYKLKNGYTINDISEYINFDMVTIFHNLKKTRDSYYSSISKKEKYPVKKIGSKKV